MQLLLKMSVHLQLHYNLGPFGHARKMRSRAINLGLNMYYMCVYKTCIYVCIYICRYINMCIKYVYNILLIVNASRVSKNNIYRNVCDRSVVNLNWGLINSHYLRLPDKWNDLLSSCWKFNQIPANSKHPMLKKMDRFLGTFWTGITQDEKQRRQFLCPQNLLVYLRW